MTVFVLIVVILEDVDATDDSRDDMAVHSRVESSFCVNTPLGPHLWYTLFLRWALHFPRAGLLVLFLSTLFDANVASFFANPGQAAGWMGDG